MERKAFHLSLFLLLFIFVNLSVYRVNAFELDPKSRDCKYKPFNILVDLTELRMYLLSKDSNEIIKTYPIAAGKLSTPSPIGTFKIVSKGEWSGGFGSRWMGLNVPWGKYGIHGTNRPQTVGTIVSHGCIRMLNEDVEDFYDCVPNGAIVTIYGGPYGLFRNSLRNLIHGDTGADVLEVQRRLQDRGYYPGPLNGIFGDKMRDYVIKFRKENKLPTSDIIDKAAYDKLGMYPFE